MPGVGGGVTGLSAGGPRLLNTTALMPFARAPTPPGPHPPRHFINLLPT